MHPPAADFYFETSGAKLRYRDEGRGCAVLLVHGWTLDLDMWEPQAAALSARFRVVRLDRRGFGLSSGLPSTAADVSDLSALCEHLELRSVALVGTSQGARAVLQFARSHPQLTSCVILDGPPHFGSQDGPAGADDIPYRYYCELAQSQGLPAFRRAWSQHPLARLRTADPQAHALLARMIARYPGTDLTNTLAHAEAADGSEPPDRPVLVINGEFDLESRKRFARQLALWLPQAECVEIPDAGHLSNLDNPRAYNDALARFLEDHALRSTAH
jgi:pimeloyl-ACP methyl ester carboxylesterase